MKALIKLFKRKEKPVFATKPEYLSNPELSMINDFVRGEAFIYKHKQKIQEEIRSLEIRIADRKEELQAIERREAFAEKLKTLIPNDTTATN